ncbi:hypothetical protein, partial [Mesonia sp. HuA40]|uniref:hypothetical protein n=1 Tax=Mesonia sp. HuA40 TaxID=2602761 RepID=UPI001C9D1514
YQAERVATVCNNGYNSLRRNFLPKIPRFFLSLSYNGISLAYFSATKSYTRPLAKIPRNEKQSGKIMNLTA